MASSPNFPGFIISSKNLENIINFIQIALCSFCNIFRNENFFSESAIESATIRIFEEIQFLPFQGNTRPDHTEWRRPRHSQ